MDRSSEYFMDIVPLLVQSAIRSEMEFYSCFCYSYLNAVSLFGKIFMVNLAFNQVFAMGQTIEGFSRDLMTRMANIEPSNEKQVSGSWQLRSIT